jgi:general L-amino acid transport system substrate-binding protein
MVPRALKIQTPRELANARICIVPGTVTDYNLNTYFQSRGLAFRKVSLRSHDQVEGEFSSGRCDALTADLSELGSIRSKMTKRDAFEILPELISKEPMAPIVRQGDDQFFNVLRWTVFALIAAEELGITSANVEAKSGSADLDVKRFLGVVPGNGRALGLDEAWAANIIKAVGNYGEIFERNVGRQSPIGFDRGLNGLWNGGGLMYAPLLRQ